MTIKVKCYISPLLSFFRGLALLSSSFPKCIPHIWDIVALFGSTYSCKQLLSKMKWVQHEISPSLPTSVTVTSMTILLSSSSIKPDIQTFLYSKQHQSSHWFVYFSIKFLWSLWDFHLSLCPMGCTQKSHLSLTLETYKANSTFYQSIISLNASDVKFSYLLTYIQTQFLNLNLRGAFNK